MKSEQTEAVSYTHLDVYKRQLHDSLTQMEEQEEGIFAEIKKHSDDIDSEGTSNKGKIAEVTVVENKDDPVADNKVGLSNDEIDVSESVVISGVQCNSQFEKDFMSLLVQEFAKLHVKFDKQEEKWKREAEKLKESTEAELTQVSGNNVFDNSEEIINQVSDNSNNELINNSCLLYTSRCV